MRPSVLVVENHHDLSSAIAAALARGHYTCDCVRTGDAALLKLREHNYQFIFVDDDAETGAADLLKKIAADPNSPKLVLLTEFERHDDVPFLRKPFDSRELLERVSE